MTRIPDLTEIAAVATDDQLVVHDTSSGNTLRVPVSKLVGIPDFGWTSPGETWSYNSWTANTRTAVLTVPTNATTKYSVGMLVRFTQTTGGTKYGRITAVTATTITLLLDGTATLTNETISSPVYSGAYAPHGFSAAPIRFTDGNGWTVVDYGSFREYNIASTNNTYAVGTGETDNSFSIALPVGVTSAQMPDITKLVVTPYRMWTTIDWNVLFRAWQAAGYTSTHINISFHTYVASGRSLTVGFSVRFCI